MSATTDPIPRFPWEDHAVLRESFLALLGAEAAAFRQAARSLYHLTLEGRERFGPDRESLVRGGLRAAALDLRQLEGFLQDCGSQAVDIRELRGPERELVFLSDRTSTELQRLALELETAVGPLPAT